MTRLSFVAPLRAAVRPFHEEVDAAFGAFDLGTRAGYRAFLAAHWQALAPIETELHAHRDLPAWRPRQALLRADLAMLDLTLMPMDKRVRLSTTAQALGALYVLEGSRLGATVLLRQLRPGLPCAYLSARHASGEWPALLASLEWAAQHGGAAWQAQAIDGARQAFAAFARAALSDLSGTEPLPDERETLRSAPDRAQPAATSP